MRLIIKHRLLSDSPLDGRTNDLLPFDNNKSQNLIQDILYGRPTCYLISGYRGAGKSSFIKKIEEDLIEKNANAKPEEKKNILFIYTSFAKYEGQTYLLRKLIRGFYYSLTCEDNKHIYDSLKDEDKKEKNTEKKLLTLIETLFERTFNEITNNHTTTNTTQESFEITTDITKIFFFLLKFLSPLLILLLFLINSEFNWIKIPDYIRLIGYICTGLLSIFTITHKYLELKEKKTEFNRKTLFDDEIAGFHFNNILLALLKRKIKVVFILDELDKVEDDEVNLLIKEMKPYLVSGLASYIVVAGQQLFYKYHSSHSKDDAVLSTLFSRVIHIPLLTISQFSELFRKFILTDVTKETELENLQPYIDFLIYKSKRVPRKFINLIRQSMIWNPEKEEAYLEVNDVAPYKKYSVILNQIKTINDDSIEGIFNEPLIDYINMKLFIKAEKILSLSRKNYFFTKKDIDDEQ